MRKVRHHSCPCQPFFFGPDSSMPPLKALSVTRSSISLNAKGSFEWSVLRAVHRGKRCRPSWAFGIRRGFSSRYLVVLGRFFERYRSNECSQLLLQSCASCKFPQGWWRRWRNTTAVAIVPGQRPSGGKHLMNLSAQIRKRRAEP